MVDVDSEMQEERACRMRKGPVQAEREEEE